MRRALLGSAVILVLMSTGCASVDQNTKAINQLKQQMVNVESALARQNLLIQQNQKNSAILMRQGEILSSKVVSKQMSQPSSRTLAKVGSVAKKKTTVAQVSSKTQSLLSDKLTTKPSIQNVQKALRNAGFYRGEIDGKVGPMTKEAVKKFQKANGLGVDGVIGKQTWAKLKEYL